MNIYKKKKYNKKIKIFYSARLDTNRGSDLILKISNLLAKENHFIFNVFCFGDYEKFKYLSKNITNRNTKLYYQKKRSFYLKQILNTDISLNLLKNKTFSKNSFPSKIIEYLLFSKTIISTVKINDLKYKNILLCAYEAKSIFNMIKFISKNINIYEKQYKKNQYNFLKTYSINSYKNILKIKFSDII